MPDHAALAQYDELICMHFAAGWLSQVPVQVNW